MNIFARKCDIRSSVKTRKTKEQSKTTKLIGDSEKTLSAATTSEHSELLKDSMSGNEKQPTKAPKPKKIKHCARCLIHGISVILKGHKRYCPYQTCENCPRCDSVIQGRQASAEETRRKRAIELDEKIMNEQLKTIMPFKSRSIPRVTGNLEWDDIHVNKDYAINISTFVELPPLYSYVSATNCMSAAQFGQSIEQLLEYSAQLGEMLPRRKDTEQQLDLLYVIMKDSKSNFNEALRRIIEATNEIRALQSWKKEVSRRSSPAYFYPAPDIMSTGAPNYQHLVHPHIPPAHSAQQTTIVCPKPLWHPLNALTPVIKVPDSPSENSDTIDYRSVDTLKRKQEESSETSEESYVATKESKT